jgi:hypothetical protein
LPGKLKRLYCVYREVRKIKLFGLLFVGARI